MKIEIISTSSQVNTILLQEQERREAENERHTKLFILHKCDNPSCVNPNHLIPGTKGDNFNDVLKRSSGTSKRLKEQDVKDIKDYLSIHKNYGEAQKLAKIYNVHPRTIGRIKRNKTWSYLPSIGA